MLIVTGLRLIHELTARKGHTNLLGMDFEAADSTKVFVSFNDFLVDAGPGYTAYLGTLKEAPNSRLC